MNVKGKKLLILGATHGETTLVTRAQKLGVYVIVTDYNKDYSKSPAKLLADECWDISWSDIDALEIKCRQTGVDGITAGYSEFRVDSLIKLCKKLDKPCYITPSQLEITRDKQKFKTCCKENGVPIVRDYKSAEDADKFPVIVKPVDRAGSIGISIASNADELAKACAYAMDMSVEKKIVIEEFIENQTKIDLYYAVEKGEITLLTSCDTINAKNNGRDRVVQSAWLYPSNREGIILNKVDDALRRMIKSMDITYGCIFFSGFINDTNDIVFFECGFRLEGGHQYNYVEQKGPYNYLDLHIAHALDEDTAHIFHKPIDTSLHCVTLNLYAKKGILTRIENVEEVKKLPGCALVMTMAKEGDECHDNQAILNKVALLQFTGYSPVDLCNVVAQANKMFGAYDENGKDIIYDRIDPIKVKNHWKGIDIKIKDDTTSFEDIQLLLNEAHKTNAEKGLFYATANQSVETLIQKIGDGVCFVAYRSDEAGNRELVGTATAEERTISYWYVGNQPTKVVLFKLFAVCPKCRGLGIGQMLNETIQNYAKQHGYGIIIIDSAEENYTIANLVQKTGFVRVDCCKYSNNNFVSAVYAKWLNQECPFSDEFRINKYKEKRLQISEKE